MASPGVLFVTLADPPALGLSYDEERTSLPAASGVVIRAGQPYEAALAEVRTYFGVTDDSKWRCLFAQRVPRLDRHFIVAASAWETLPAEADLEFIVLPVYRPPGVPAVGDMGMPAPAQKALASPISRNSLEYEAPAKFPAAWLPSQDGSQCVTPATPSGSETESRANESEADEGPTTGWNRNEQAAQSVERGDPREETPRRSGSATPSTAEQDRRRSATPSPSNRSQECKPRLLRHLEGEDHEDEDESAQSEAGQRPDALVAGPVPGRSSGETEVSLMVGLDANGNVTFVPRSPPPPQGADFANPSGAKGKGKARTVTPGGAVSEGRSGDVEPRAPASAGPIGELFSSQAVKPTLFLSQPIKPSLSSQSAFSFSSPAFKPQIPRADSTDSDDQSDDVVVCEPIRRPPVRDVSSDSNAYEPELVGKRPPPTTGANPSPSKRRRTLVSASTRQSTPQQHRASPQASPRKTGSARKPTKTREDKRREALSRPRVPIPPGSRSERFHYYIRLPNWPVTPKNANSPLNPKLLFKHMAKEGVKLELKLIEVFNAASRHSGWDVRDLRATFYVERGDGDHERLVVWGWDTPYLGFLSLEDMGLRTGGVIDFDLRRYSGDRSYLATE